MKSIVVPKNKQADIDLDYDRADESVLITWNLLDSEYEELYTLGIFDKINDLCNSLIDEYEDEHIPANRLSPILEYYSKSSNVLVQKLIKLCSDAIEMNTSIHFYF